MRNEMMAVLWSHKSADAEMALHSMNHVIMILLPCQAVQIAPDLDSCSVRNRITAAMLL